MRKLLAILFSVTSLFITACGANGSGAGAAAAPESADPADREAQARREGLVLKRYDLNRDEVPDVFKYFRIENDPKDAGNELEVLVRKELDINHDGKIDIIYAYDDAGQKIEERIDLDFDGRIDGVKHFKNGLLVRQEVDLNYDGSPDVTRYYQDEKLVRIESDRNGDRKVDTWEYYVGEQLDRIGTDTDLDGEADTWERKAEGEPADEGAAVAEPDRAETAAESTAPAPAE